MTDSGKNIALEFGIMHKKYINELLRKIDDEKKDEFFNAVKFIKGVLMEISEKPDDLFIPGHICHKTFEKK